MVSTLNLSSVTGAILLLITVKLLSLRVSLLDGGIFYPTVVLNNYVLRCSCGLIEGGYVIRAVFSFVFSRGQRPWKYLCNEQSILIEVGQN
jgi:hypothetical protein